MGWRELEIRNLADDAGLDDLLPVPKPAVIFILANNPGKYLPAIE